MRSLISILVLASCCVGSGMNLFTFSVGCSRDSSSESITQHCIAWIGIAENGDTLHLRVEILSQQPEVAAYRILEMRLQHAGRFSELPITWEELAWRDVSRSPYIMREWNAYPK